MLAEQGLFGVHVHITTNLVEDIDVRPSVDGVVRHDLARIKLRVVEYV